LVATGGGVASIAVAACLPRRNSGRVFDVTEYRAAFDVVLLVPSTTIAYLVRPTGNDFAAAAALTGIVVVERAIIVATATTSTLALFTRRRDGKGGS